MSLLANYFQRENFPIYKSLNAKIGYSHSHLHVKKFSRTCLLLLSFPAQGAVGGWILYINTLPHNFWLKKGVGRQYIMGE